jgi:hypothetical protein
LISPPVTLVTEKLDKKGPHDACATGVNPSQNRSQATKIQQCGAVCRWGHLQQSSGFRRCRYHAWGHSSLKGRPKRTARCLSNRRESKPKPQPSHENPAMRVRMSTGKPPTEFEFSPLLISPPVTLVTEKLDKKGPHDACATGVNPSQNRSRATNIQQCRAVCRRGHLQQSSSFLHCRYHPR